jgi:hypothetical protein
LCSFGAGWGSRRVDMHGTSIPGVGMGCKGVGAVGDGVGLGLPVIHGVTSKQDFRGLV